MFRCIFTYFSADLQTDFFLSQFTKDLLSFTVESNLAFNVAQQPAFKTMLENLSGRKISIPTTKRIMQTLDQQYDRMKTNLKSILSKQKYVCATCDVWTSRAKSFLGMTVHFIDSKYVRQSYVLAFRQLKQKQT